jgi:HlyD family secretion protein
MDAFLAWLTGLIAVVIPGFGATELPRYNGYVEARYVYASPVGSGQIESISVREGDSVLEGDLLFRLKQDQQISALQAAEARVAAAEANLANLTTGARADEVDVARASLQKAQADLDLARDSAARTEKLFDQGLVPQSRRDQDNATLKSAEALVKQLEAQLKVTELPARDAQQQQAEANLTAARADAEKANWDLADRTITSPTAGRIERVYYDAGEMVAAGSPVVSILPAGALKVKFYLPEAARPDFGLGDKVGVSCDGCPDDLVATISFLASDPQFTPPVIYSRDERQRLSFLVEATLDGVDLPPGQPVTVEHGQ